MEQNLSLFERIGGMKSVEAAVDIFYAKVLEDEKINHFFATTNMTMQLGKMKSFLAYAFGAPTHIAVYTGKKMRDAHAHLSITEDHFNIVASHLIVTLQELGVAKTLIDEVTEIALSTKKDVLGI